jgi:hypothetical protein
VLHTVAFETSASEAALTSITPVPDGTVAIISNDLRIPVQVPMIVAVAALINSAAATLKAELVSPKLRSIFPFDVSPIVNGLVFGSLPRYLRLWQNPLALDPLEALNFQFQNGAAVMNRGIVWLADKAVTPIGGKIFTVRATAAASLVTATWVNASLTFQNTLPAGHYQIVGMRAWSANGVAARLFVPSYAWRPGVPMVNAEDNNDAWEFRYGGVGVMAEFDHTVPPTVDFLGVTDTSETVFLDLIKTS